MSPQREIVTAAEAPKAAGPYSHAIRAGGLLYCSGQTPLDPTTGKLVPGNAGEQAARCLENLSIVCEAAGAQLADAVRIGVYVTDMGTFGEVNQAYTGFFPGGHQPARTTIGVASLPLGANVEMDAIVAL